MPAEAANIEEQQTPVASTTNKVLKVPGVQLEIPLGKDVVVRIPSANQTYKGKIVGYEPYEYLIAQVRLPSKVRQDLALGGQLILKYVHQGSVYGFRAIVTNAIASPASLIFFEYPSIIEKIALRRSSRAMCSIDGLLQTIEDEYECMVVNVSESGCKISARAGTRDDLARTKVGETMVISMTLGHYGMLKLPIAIRNLTLEKGILSLGAQFLDINKSEMEVINRYLEKIAKFTR